MTSRCRSRTRADVDTGGAERLAAILRELRGHIPDNVWWDSGAAEALIEYEARHGSGP